MVATGLSIGRTGVVSAVVVVEGRDGGHELLVESVHPGKKHAGVGLVFAVAQADAGILRHEIVAGMAPFSMSLGLGS